MASRFDIDCSAKVLEELDALRDQARQDGREHDVDSALRTIFKRLQSDPTDFGEPLYNLRHLKLEVWVGIVSPLLVYFAVETDKRFVIIQRFKLI